MAPWRTENHGIVCHAIETRPAFAAGAILANEGRRQTPILVNHPGELRIAARHHAPAGSVRTCARPERDHQTSPIAASPALKGRGLKLT